MYIAAAGMSPTPLFSNMLTGVSIYSLSSQHICYVLYNDSIGGVVSEEEKGNVLQLFSGTDILSITGLCGSNMCLLVLAL